MQDGNRIAIIGGGFSGVALAAQLLRRVQGDLDVTLIEAGSRLGRGVAYGTHSERHLLNTRAAQMSLFADDPEHFVRWLAHRGEPLAPSAFVQRRLYARYLESTLGEQAARRRGGRFDAHLERSALDVRAEGTGFAVALDDGQTLRASAVVLATGHPPPADPLTSLLPRGATRYLRNPWRQSDLARIPAGARVLLLGTGLTMVDVALELAERAPRCRLSAISRRGLLPREHARAAQPLPPDIREQLFARLAKNDLRSAIRAVRLAVDAARDRGLDWHTVIDGLRPATPRLWAAMCTADRQRFVGTLRAFWDVHRHRMAPESAAAIAALRERRQLTIEAGRVRGVAERGHALLIDVAPRGSMRVRRESFDWIVNCTGSTFGLANSRVLERRLCERGLLLIDPLGLGYVTEPDGTAFGGHGPVRGLYVLGPACRARSWENTAVPEIRAQADALAGALTDALSAVAQTR
jgi:uncharacterized NAD(P)/FAD-binding protein YdhS